MPSDSAASIVADEGMAQLDSTSQISDETSSNEPQAGPMTLTSILHPAATILQTRSSQRASSEGRQPARRPLDAVTYRRTGSDTELVKRVTQAQDDDDAETGAEEQDSTSRHSSGLVTPRSSSSPPSSPSPSTSSRAQRTESVSSPGTTATTNEMSTAEKQSSSQQLDEVLLLALNHPRDRMLLLRAEIEMDKFIASATMNRLPLSPPYFQPALNSYQRLLIHRLADAYGITRQVEPAPVPSWAVNANSPTPGIVVLVKGENSTIPLRKLASFVPPPPEPQPLGAASVAAVPATVPLAATSPAPLTVSALASAAAAESSSASPSPTSPALLAPGSSSTTTAAAPMPQFKILPRSKPTPRAPSSSASSSVNGGDDNSSSRGGRSRRELTLEEREQAYREARERIFAQQPVASPIEGREDKEGRPIPRPSSAASSTSRGGSSGQPRVTGSLNAGSISTGGRLGSPAALAVDPAVHSRMRPSAPSFDPAAWGTPAVQYGSVAPDYAAYYTGNGQPSAAAYAYSPSPPLPVPTHAGSRPPRPPPLLPQTGVSQAPYPHPSAAVYTASHYPPLGVSHSTPSSSPPPPIPSVPNAWNQRNRPPSLPSPSLSTCSSGGSSSRHLNSSSAAPSATSDRASTSSRVSSTSSNGGGGGGGPNYLMRFPDGAVIGYTPHNATSSSSYARTSSSNSPSVRSSSASVASSSASASTSRTASSSSNLRGGGTGGGGSNAGGSVGMPPPDYTPIRRTSHSATHSLSSAASGSGSATGSRSPAPQQSGSAVAKGKQVQKPDHSYRVDEVEGTKDAPETDGKTTRELTGSPGVQMSETVKTKSVPLNHPSLPAKPVWASAAAAVSGGGVAGGTRPARTGVGGASDSGKTHQNWQQPHPSQAPTTVRPAQASPPPAHPPIVPYGGSVPPPPPPISSRAGARVAWSGGPSGAPVSSSLAGPALSHQVSYAGSHGPAPHTVPVHMQSVPAWTAIVTASATPAVSGPGSKNVPHGYGKGAAGHQASHQSLPHPPPLPTQHSSMMPPSSLADVRRPPPRSTELFDPNRPGVGPDGSTNVNNAAAPASAGSTRPPRAR